MLQAFVEALQKEAAIIVAQEEDEDPEDVAAVEVAELFYASGDPRGGYGSQRSTIFVNHEKAQFGIEGVDGTIFEVAQQSDRLRLAGVTGCVVWDGAVVLSKSLALWSDEGLLSLSGLRVLELGAGTGLLALAVAALGAHVVATEQAERLRLLKKNVERHSRGQDSSGAPCQIGGRGGSVEVAELDWFSPGPVRECDLILATDVVYTEEVTTALVKCLSAYIGIPCVVSLALRTEEVHFSFISALAGEGFVVHRLPLQRFPEELQTPRIITYVLSKPR